MLHSLPTANYELRCVHSHNFSEVVLLWAICNVLAIYKDPSFFVIVCWIWFFMHWLDNRKAQSSSNISILFSPHRSALTFGPREREKSWATYWLPWERLLPRRSKSHLIKRETTFQPRLSFFALSPFIRSVYVAATISVISTPEDVCRNLKI